MAGLRAGDGIDLESGGRGGTMNAFFRKLGWLVGRRDKEKELREELQFHLEEEAERYQAAGASTEDARWAARRELGNMELVREDARSAWGWTLVEQFGQDLRYALRMMVASKSFSLLAILTLALGIGANTAIYSLIDALLMRSLPVTDPASLVVLKWHVAAKNDTDDTVVHHASGYFNDDPKLGLISSIFPFRAFEALRQSTGALSEVS